MNRSDLAASVAKAAPALGGNFWLWLQSHDINWWVALLTAGYISLQAFYLIKNHGRGR
jgi:hypothetical protein